MTEIFFEMKTQPLAMLLLSSLFVTAVLAETPSIPDWRNIRKGSVIPTKSYADQPYVVQTDDGAWLCVVTTGAGEEGQPGQHIVSLRSTDHGKTWSAPVPVEPADGPEASYAVLLKAPSGRIYVFYNHNTDNVRQIKADNPPYPNGLCSRVDSQGYFVFKFSDDHGLSWSAKRYPIPVREMEIDRENPYGGAIRFFWNVGKPFIFENAAYVPLIKVGGIGHGFFTRNEGVLLRCENLPLEKNPEKFTWETLPEGDAGLRTPPGGGPIAAEHSYVVLSDGSFYVVYRTIDGHPACAYSRDRGRTWTTPEYQRYADRRLMKHPRAANFLWKCRNGKYLYWFHNHGGKWYDDRNPVWLCGGVEVDTPEGRKIQWSQPEIVLYDDDSYIRMSYPDLIETDSTFYLTETQKNIARVHRIDSTLIHGLWAQFDKPRLATEGLVADSVPVPGTVPMPKIPYFLRSDSRRADRGTRDMRAGFSIEMWLDFAAFRPGEILLDNRLETGQGFCVQTAANGTIEIILNDGRSESRWRSDPARLRSDSGHHVVVVVDGGPKIISFIIDGQFCDGGSFRQFGWGRFSPALRHVYGRENLEIAPKFSGKIQRLRVYNRALRTSEAVGNFRTGLAAE